MVEFSNNRTPGPDGLPAEFYKVFFPDLYDILIDVVNEVMATNVKPLSMQCAVTVLLPKGEDPQQPSTDRPITFLNTDLDILVSGSVQGL